MIDKFKKYSVVVTTIVAIGGLMIAVYQAHLAAKAPVLRYYVVKVSPEIQDDDLQRARLDLENSLCQSVINLIEQNPNLSCSEALDEVLPVRATITNSVGGIVIVIQNQGGTTAHNLRVNIRSDAAIEDYRIFANEDINVIQADERGTLKFDVNRLTVGDQIQIALLFSGDYVVSVVAMRADYNVPPEPMSTVQEAIAAQTATASSMREIGRSGFLQFYVEDKLDDVRTTVFVSSDEVQGVAESIPGDTSQEKLLFFRMFQP